MCRRFLGDSKALTDFDSCFYMVEESCSRISNPDP